MKKYEVRVSELRYGSVEVEAENEEQAKAYVDNRGAAINWFDSEITDVTAEPVQPEATNDYIRARLHTPEILCQLAEEAAELSQAALKLRRALDRTNPTPVSSKDALDGLLEELADVSVCADLLLLPDQRASVREMTEKKRTRWADRLRATETDDRDFEVTEVCPHCEREVTMTWDVLTDGFKAFCPHCGGRLMLCDECQHCEVDPVICDYDRESDTCQFNPGKKAEQQEPALMTFIREEVRFRLDEMLNVAKGDLTPELVEDLTDVLSDNSDVMFNYDRLDDFLAAQLDNRGVKHD